MAGRRRTPATQQRQSSILVWLGGEEATELIRLVGPATNARTELMRVAGAGTCGRAVNECVCLLRTGSPVCGSHGLGPLEPGTSLPLALAWACTGVTP